MSKAVANLTQSTETITFSAQDNGETISVNITEAARGAAGAAGPAGPNSVTSATTSDGTANLSLSNVTTATAEVTGTLTANHIHGNLAGSVYAHVRAGENLAKGDPVYVSGSHGTGANLIAIVSKADASDPLKMPAVGVMDAAVTANANGHMVITGTISDINTAAYSVNAELYVAEGGGFTATAPLTYAQPVARVERSNTNNGAIIVKVNGLSAYDNTGNTLVRRNANGDSVFSALSFPSAGVGATELGVNNDGSIETNPSVVLPGASGTLALTSNLSGVVSIAYGGTNATTASSARTNLGLGTADAPAFANLSLTSGTITTSQPLSLTQTWNAGAVTFKGIDVNITDTASASGSLLMDLRVGGLTLFNVGRNGESGRQIVSVVGRGSVYTEILSRFSTSGFGTQFAVMGSGGARGVFVGQNCGYGFSNTSSANSTVDNVDLYLYRDAGGTLAQRNGTNAQESRVYGTYTSATNFERLNLKYNGTATAFQIGTEKGSTGGTIRPLEFQTDGTTRVSITATGTTGVWAFGTFAGSAILENSSSAYLKSNGNLSIGGTNFIVFRYGASQTIGWTIDANGHFRHYGSGTGTLDIGTSSNLVRSVYTTNIYAVGGSVGVGTTSPASKLTVTDGDAEVTDSASGIILKSPDGTRYRIKVANGGTLTVTAV